MGKAFQEKYRSLSGLRRDVSGYTQSKREARSFAKKQGRYLGNLWGTLFRAEKPPGKEIVAVLSLFREMEKNCTSSGGREGKRGNR